MTWNSARKCSKKLPKTTATHYLFIMINEPCADDEDLSCGFFLLYKSGKS